MSNFSEPPEPLVCYCVSILKVSCSLIISMCHAVVVLKSALLDRLLFNFTLSWFGATLVNLRV